jgi:hypothetical protein
VAIADRGGLLRHGDLLGLGGLLVALRLGDAGRRGDRGGLPRLVM